jgi:hypothetical protein
MIYTTYEIKILKSLVFALRQLILSTLSFVRKTNRVKKRGKTITNYMLHVTSYRLPATETMTDFSVTM